MVGPGLDAALVRCSISPEPLILLLLPQPQDKYLSPGSACSPCRPAAEQYGDHSLPLVREECPYLLASLSWQRPDGTHNPALPELPSGHPGHCSRPRHVVHGDSIPWCLSPSTSHLRLSIVAHSGPTYRNYGGAGSRPKPVLVLTQAFPTLRDSGSIF